MTPDQIRQIAEEYAHSIFDVDKSDPNLNEKNWQEQFDMAVDVMKEMLEWLDKNYNIKIVKDELDAPYEHPYNSKEP